MSFFVLSILFDTSINLLTFFFSFPFARTMFPSLQFHCLSFGLKGVFCRQHIAGSFFFFLIHLVTLWLLIVAFSSLTFRVIRIGMYLLPFFWVFPCFCNCPLTFLPLLFFLRCDAFSVMLRFLSLYFLCIYYRFLVCGSHDSYMTFCVLVYVKLMVTTGLNTF